MPKACQFLEICRVTDADRSVVQAVDEARWRLPAALILVMFGILLTLAMHSSIVSSLSFGPSMPKLVLPTREEWATGMPPLALQSCSFTHILAH